VTVELEPITRDQISTDADRQYQAAVELLTQQAAVIAGVTAGAT